MARGIIRGILTANFIVSSAHRIYRLDPSRVEFARFARVAIYIDFSEPSAFDRECYQDCTPSPLSRTRREKRHGNADRKK